MDDRRLRRAGRKAWLPALLSVFVCLVLTGSLPAETIESLDRSLTSLLKERAALQGEYRHEKELQEARGTRIRAGKASEADVQQAYLSAARLEQMTAQFREIDLQRQDLCTRWRTRYREEIDSLLAQAEKEKDGRKKLEIGRKLQSLQARNAALCPELSAPATLEWKTLQLEPYDGPKEIEQKVQLLKDISREMTLRLRALESSYERAKREQRTRERALEFIQEGTLFEERVSVRGPATPEASTTRGESVSVTSPDMPDSPASGSISDKAGAPEMQPEWPSRGNARTLQKMYEQQRQELEQNRREVQQMIEKFEVVAQSLLEH